APDVFERFERQIEGFGGRRTQQAMRVIDRTQQRLLLIIAAVFADRAGGEQLFIKLISILETVGRHPARRADGIGGLVGESDIERTIFAAEKTAGSEGLEF